jgi:exopolysaccharide production protein ExoQ
MPSSRFAAALEPAVARWLPVAVFLALPTLGLAAGPSYSSLIFGLAGVMLVGRLAAGGRLPPLDPSLVGLAVGFLMLCWASTLWSIAPPDSLRGAAQMTGILLGALVTCLVWGQPDRLPSWFFPALLAACVAGALAAGTDMRLGNEFERLITHRSGPASLTKYNRGLDYLALIVWPVAAHARWRRNWWALALLLAAVALALGIGVSLAGRVAFVLGLVVLLVAIALPRLAALGLGLATFIWGLAGPLLLHALARREALLAPHLKRSSIDRLEIWSYMTDRIAERPLLGWGLQSAKSVPIRPAELASFRVHRAVGVYPHDQWLQLWVELGAVGAALGVAFALLVLARACRLPSDLRPFALAAFAAAMAVASVNYEVTTDSWWAALAATGALFLILRRRVAGEIHP